MPKVARITAPGRRTKASSTSYDATQTLPPLRMPPAPRGGWHPRTRRQWRELTSAAWIGLLQDSDRVLLERWALLVDAMHRALEADAIQTASVGRLSAEIRALETSIGATPRSRAALAWNGAGSERPRRGLASVTTLAMDEVTLAEVRADAARLLAEEVQP